ncbi:MAG: YraN family protein [Planctomycetaceae bacterium]|jgi:putative endonuclease|nr:YraN family protein [Planctomycetaceae bacterium]
MICNFKKVKRYTKSIWQRIKNFFNDLFLYFSNDPLLRIKFLSDLKIRKSISNKPKDQLARAGENEAVQFLKDNNYFILKQNVVLKDGEIDIIAKDKNKNMLVFVEVKTRSSKIFGQPYEAVTPQKQKRLYNLAEQLIYLLKLKKVNYRIDVISILWEKNSTPEIIHIKDIKLL